MKIHFTSWSWNLSIFAMYVTEKQNLCKPRKKLFSKKLLDVESPHYVSKQSQRLFERLQNMIWRNSNYFHLKLSEMSFLKSVPFNVSTFLVKTENQFVILVSRTDRILLVKSNGSWSQSFRKPWTIWWRRTFRKL